MSVYFIRHGQTGLNKSVSFNGEDEEALNETGFAQAENAAKELEGIKFDAIYSSPQLRTMLTLASLDLDSEIPVFYDRRLKERRAGNLIGKNIDSNFLKNVYLNINIDPQIDGIESISEVFERVHGLLNEIKQNYADKNVLLVSHGFIGRAVYYYFNPLPKSGFLDDNPESFPHNCEIKKFDFTSKESKKEESPVQMGE